MSNVSPITLAAFKINYSKQDNLSMIGPLTSVLQ
jgi:hypothetical protein